uniref:Iron-sulfur cluster loop n=1 Tax=Thermosphaera aggregans TaxID=54254 RepID=A0A7C2FPF5_9CREN
MELLGIDTLVIDRMSRILQRNSEKMQRLDVFNPKFYPPSNEGKEQVLRYFTVMVAMDHRLSRPGRVYEACLEDGCYKGADLLYRLGKMKLDEKPDFFNPEYLSKIKEKDVEEWLSIGDARPVDIELRTRLLRDLGEKLIKLYDGMVSTMLDASNNRLHGDGINPGLADLLRVFRAFEDPVEKKSMLLAKFLYFRGLFKPIDKPYIPVDNHLTRIALRTGMVVVSGRLWNNILNMKEVSLSDDIMIRLIVREAYGLLSEKSGLSVWELDDHFWIHGRTICIRSEQPLCEKCMFKGFCKARRNNAFMVYEHTYYNTWYY